ncbi:phage head spike fiber domain-containing protein [Sphingomonas japonica]|uniref:Phage tail protein n=1 Tax=Sphingomonas japonica TaxID=511662 RepID=A0ABX0TZR6_9SPHN|nr:hypothetical protein [Sphingomonas japonica]NIJ23728.1 hypothetical protein [Sphingomonas japonica]
MAAIAVGIPIGRRNARAGFDFTGPALPPGAVLTRASAATCVTAQGLLATLPPDAPRFDHDPASGRRRGLLIEDAATNIVIGSSAFAAAPWIADSLSLASGAPAPDGSASATLATDASETAYGVMSQNFAARAQPSVASLFVRKDAVAASVRSLLLRLRLPQHDLKLDTASGALVASGPSAGVIDHGAYWRAWVSADAGVSSVWCYIAVAQGVLGAGNSPTVTGSATIWGMQVENGVRPTSAIATESAAATRARDRLTLDWSRWGIVDAAMPVRYVFDDGSSEVRTATVAAGLSEAPNDLGRAHIARIERA